MTITQTDTQTMLRVTPVVIGHIYATHANHSLLQWHTPRSVAVLTTSWQRALSDALHHKEFSPRFSGLRSFSTVRSQDVVKDTEVSTERRLGLSEFRTDVTDIEKARDAKLKLTAGLND